MGRASHPGRLAVDLALPEAILVQAERVHRAAVDVAAEEIRRELEHWTISATGGRTDALSDFPGNLARLLERVRQRFSEGAIFRALNAVSLAVDAASVHRLAKVPGIDIRRILPGGRAALERFRDANARLIESVPVKMAADIGATLRETDVSSLHVKDVGKILESRFGVARSQGEFWARDQTLKLYGQVNQERMQAAGVGRYRWICSDDERVRGRPGGLWPHGGDHWSLNNGIFTFDQPPIVDPRTGRRANPGGDYQCRCTAYPVFD